LIEEAEQETIKRPSVVSGCVVIWCTTYYKMACVECYKNL